MQVAQFWANDPKEVSIIAAAHVMLLVLDTKTEQT